MLVDLAESVAGNTNLTPPNNGTGTGQRAEPLERMVQLAAKVLAAPFVYVLLIEDGRETVVAASGQPAESLPGMARLNERLPDATGITRQLSAPPRAGRLQVYSAAPLPLVQGSGQGSLVAAGYEQRAWGAADEELLFDFAATAGAILEARAAARLSSMRVRDLQRDLARASLLNPERLRLITENAQEIIYRFEIKPVRGYTYVSPSVLNVLGYTPDQFYSDPDMFTRLVLPDDGAALQVNDPGAATMRETVVRMRHRDGHTVWVDLSRVPLKNSKGEVVGFEGAARDVTQFMRTAEALTYSEQRFRELFDSAQRQAQELALLDQVRTALTRVLDLDVIYRTVVEAIADTFGYNQVSIYAIENEMLLLQHQVGYDTVFSCVPITSGVMGRAVGEGQPVLVEDVTKDPNFLGSIAGIASEVSVPLFDHEVVVGVLNVESTGNVRLTDADLRLMSALGEQASIAINRARLYTAARDNELKYRSVVENVTEVIFQTDERGMWSYLNPAWQEITGFPVELSIGLGMVHFVHPDDRQRYESQVAALLKGEQDNSRYEIRCQTVGNGTRWLEVHSRPLTGPGGAIIGISGTLNDINERKLAEEALLRQNEELAALHETTLGLINQLDVNSLLETLLTRTASFMGTQHAYLYLIDPGGSEMVMQLGMGVFEKIIGTSAELGSGLSGHVWETGAPAAIEDYLTWAGRRPELEQLGVRSVAGMPLRAGAEVVGVLGVAFVEEGRSFSNEDVAQLNRFGQLASLALENARLYAAAQQELTERKRAEERLAYLAMHDPLTSLPNRSLFNDRLQQAILSSTRDNEPLALLVMDVDRFKEVNDTLGHHVGDKLLQQIGHRLSAALRASDTVARLGGDEFAVVLPGADEAGSARAAQKLIDAMEKPFALENHSLDVHLSIGVALLPDHGQEGDALLRRADVAMYVAKRDGTGYAFYSPVQDPYSPDRLALAGELRQAIEQDDLALYFQPKVSNRTGHVVGVEALVRWRHPQRGLLPPDQFIPLAEHTGLIRLVSQWVLSASLEQCRLWLDRGITLPVAANLSMRDLHDSGLPGAVERLLETWRIDPSLLTVEITEDVVMSDLTGTLDVLTRLRALGVRLAIDDFGTGQSSLAQLKRLPVGQLKIDKSFVREMAENENDAVIVRSTIDLGHNLGLTVVAEGVENEASLTLLTQLGCDEAQGYYLSRPVPAEDVVTWLKERGEHNEYESVGGASSN